MNLNIIWDYQLDSSIFDILLLQLQLMMVKCVFKYLFICVEVLRPIQPNGVMSSAVSLTIHTFTGQV